MIVKAGITYKYKNLLWYDQTSRKLLFMLVTFFTCFHLPPSPPLPTIICHTHPSVCPPSMHPWISSAVFLLSGISIFSIPCKIYSLSLRCTCFAYQTCSPNDCPSDIHPSPFQRKSSNSNTFSSNIFKP